tara:strand:+ start:2948 stop:3160 length:213 start_codon:yes stop_codon:yes gene_type:complete
MKNYFTVVTASDKSLDGKSFYSGQGKTEQKSIDRALENFTIGKHKNGDDTILSIRTYDDISNVSLKAIRT